jgi:hypothetical protein
MSCSRSETALCGTPCLAQNALAQRWTKRILRQEIDGASEPLLEIVLEPNQREEAYRSIELDDQVDVTVFACLASRDRAEEEKRLDTLLSKLSLVPGKRLDDIFSPKDHGETQAESAI